MQTPPLAPKARAHRPRLTLLPPGGHKRISFDDRYDCLTIAHSDGSSIDIYRCRTTETDHRTFPPHTWFGSECRVDSNGRKWSSQLPLMVQDDFGNLVAVAR